MFFSTKLGIGERAFFFDEGAIRWGEVTEVCIRGRGEKEEIAYEVQEAKGAIHLIYEDRVYRSAESAYYSTIPLPSEVVAEVAAEALPEPGVPVIAY